MELDHFADPLHPLDLRMDAGDSHHIRDSPETYRLPWLSVYPVGLEYFAYFQLSAPAFALAPSPQCFITPIVK